jgi:hypothetical protein
MKTIFWHGRRLKEPMDYSRWDLSRNERIAVPEDERIRVPCIWLLECFAPSQFPALLNALPLLTDRQTAGFRADELWSFVQGARHSSGGWATIGEFVSPLGKRIGAERAQVPPGVDEVLVQVHATSGSVTTLLIQFILTEDESLAVDRAIRQTFQTYETPHAGGSGATIHTPDFQQRDAAKTALTNTIEVCSHWVFERAKGAFGSIQTKTLPAWALIATDRAIPFSDERADYLRSVGIHSSMMAWGSAQELPGLLVSAPSWFPEPDELMFVAGNRPAAQQAKRLEKRDRTLRTVAALTNVDLARTIVVWGWQLMLRTYRAQLARVRDTLSEASTRRSRGVLRRLRAAQKDLLMVAADAQQVALHARREAQRDLRRFARGMPDLTPQNPKVWEGDLTYPGLLQLELQELASRTSEEEKDIRGMIVAASSIQSSIVSIRLQRWVLILTFVLVIVGAATIWATRRPSSTSPTPTQIRPTVVVPSPRAARQPFVTARNGTRRDQEGSAGSHLPERPR